MPRIRQLEIVRALAQHRHFGRAAQALGMSQPNLTRGLKQLEALLGVPIFDRQGVTPTSFGEIILRHGDKALASFHELTRELSLAKGLEIGELRIIAGPYPANISGERAVGILLQKHPNIFAEIRSANWERAIGDVLEGTADLGFAEVTGALKNDELQVQPVRKSPVFFFCAAGHPLAGRKGVTSRICSSTPGRGQASRNAIARRSPPRIDRSRSSAQIGLAFIRAHSSGRSPLPSRSSWADMCSALRSTARLRAN
jgi:DNA-binding transcriptional LysR family regulator